MNRPLEIRDVGNISLEASDDNSDIYPQLVAQFTCQDETISDCIRLQYREYVCCSVIWMFNVTHSAIEGISITVRTPYVSGAILQQCSHLHIQSITCHTIQELYNDIEYGIIVYESSDIEMDSYEASNFSYGVMLYNAKNTSMMNISAVNNGYNGLRLYYSTNTSMMNISVAHSVSYGIYLYCSTDTSMIKVSAVHSEYNGIVLDHSTNTSMMNVTAEHSKSVGILLFYSMNTRMMDVSAEHNHDAGIRLYDSFNTSLDHTYTYHNRYSIYIIGCTTTHIVFHNTGNKIYVIESTDTHILKSVLSEHSEIEMTNAVNVYITNTTSLITAYNTKNIVLNDTVLTNMDVTSTASSTSEPASLPAVITLYNSTLTITDCTFTRNNISSIKTIGSSVTMSGKVLFLSNTASSGTVLISAKNSLLMTTDYSNILFQNNHAINYGGVFYITTEESYETSMSLQDIIQGNKGGGSLITSRTECFVHVEGSRSYAQLTFINNTAGKGGDVLYGGLVALGYDGDWNCLLSFKNISDMSQQSSLSLISSTPSRVCLCNETGQLDCLTVADLTTRVIYPGQTITLPVVVVGKDFGTVTGSVFAQFLHTPYTTDSVDMKQKQDNVAVEHGQCSNLEYTIFSQSEESTAVLVLTHDNRDISYLMNEEDDQKITNSWEILNKEPNYKTLAQDIICDFIDFQQWPRQFTIKYNESGNRTIENFYVFTPADIARVLDCSIIQTKFVFPKEIYSYPVYINISFRPCPPGFSLSKDPPFRCDCNQLMKQLPGVKCHIQDETISRSGLVWISSDGNETMAASNCPFNYCNREEINMTLEDPDSQCNFNHSGTLCGGCQPGLSLALGSNRCMNCSNTNLALLLPFALAGVILVCFLKVIDLTISQGILNGLIFYANVVKVNEYLLYYDENQTNPLAVFIAWLNLDFGVETCFFNGLLLMGRHGCSLCFLSTSGALQV